MPRVSPSAKQRRPLAQYVALGVQFLMALTYEGRYIVYAFPDRFGRANAANWPFLVGVTNEDLSIAFLTPEAKEAGLHEGLVIFTDGVSEAMNPADEEWGEARMIEAIEHSDSLSAGELIAKLMQAADTFASGAKQHDDMTLVVLRVLETAY
jgi:hypothetical protein